MYDLHLKALGKYTINKVTMAYQGQHVPKLFATEKNHAAIYAVKLPIFYTFQVLDLLKMLNILHVDKRI